MGYGEGGILIIDARYSYRFGHQSRGRERLRIEQNRRVRSGTQYSRRSIISPPIANNKRGHRRTMRHVYSAVTRFPAGIIGTHSPGTSQTSSTQKIIFCLARGTTFNGCFERDIRIGQRRIIGHRLSIDHRDLHTFAGDILLPCVTHAHVIHIPIPRGQIGIISHRNRRTHRTSHHHSHDSTNQTPRVPLHRPALHHKNISQPQEN